MAAAASVAAGVVAEAAAEVVWPQMESALSEIPYQCSPYKDTKINDKEMRVCTQENIKAFMPECLRYRRRNNKIEIIPPEYNV